MIDFYFVWFLLFVVLGIKPSVLCMLGQDCTSELLTLWYLLHFSTVGRRVKVCWHSRAWLPQGCCLVECWLEDGRPCKVVMMLCNLLCLRWTGAHLTLLLTVHIMHAGNSFCFLVPVSAADIAGYYMIGSYLISTWPVHNIDRVGCLSPENNRQFPSFS